MQNSTLAALTANAPKHVLHAIKGASAKTGVDFAYMVQQAKAESAFNPTAKARTSSATGLYQFIESTWMTMVNKHGEKYGIDPTADKQTLLNMRKDPQKAAFMAAEFAKDNKEFLEQNVTGDIGATEMYFAHFLGASGASGFLNALHKSPNDIAAHIFPKESAANRNVFYDTKTGEPRTLEQVYAFFDKKFGGTPSSQTPTPQKHIESPAFKDYHPPQSANTTYVAIPQNLQNSIQSLYSNTKADAVTALLAFGQNDIMQAEESGNKDKQNSFFAATRSLYSNTKPSMAYQKTANNAHNRGAFGNTNLQDNLQANLPQSLYSRIALSQLDLLSLYNTDILA